MWTVNMLGPTGLKSGRVRTKVRLKTDASNKVTLSTS